MGVGFFECRVSGGGESTVVYSCVNVTIVVNIGVAVNVSVGARQSVFCRSGWTEQFTVIVSVGGREFSRPRLWRNSLASSLSLMTVSVVVYELFKHCSSELSSGIFVCISLYLHGGREGLFIV